MNSWTMRVLITARGFLILRRWGSMERSKAPKLRTRAWRVKVGRLRRRWNVVRAVRCAPADFVLFCLF